MTRLDLLSLPIPLAPEAHAQAAQLAAVQATPGKGRQVYLNTLAVYAVHTYFNWLGLESDLPLSDSGQAGLTTVLDVADLAIPGVGRVECRPVLPGETALTLPLEATCDRIGYVAVQFNDSLDGVELLGFAPLFPADQPILAPPVIPLSDLLPLDALLNALHPVHNLRQWLEGLLDQTQWQPPETLVAARFRGSSAGPRSRIQGTSTAAEAGTDARSISQAKALALGPSPQQVVILVIQVVAVSPETDILNVRLRLYPGSGADHLPRQLKVSVLSDLGSVLLEAQTRDEDLYTELELTDCRPGEQFSVRISLKTASVVEEFVV